MIRKLHNTLLAASASGLMLVFGLMASSPLVTSPQGNAAPGLSPAMASIDSATDVRIASAEARARRIEARALRLESDLERSTSLGDTIAGAVSFAAAVSTDVALNAALEASGKAAEERAEETEQRRHARKVRSALAFPYFSFAQGLRRNSRS